jgi:hypothetical protein
MTYRIFSISRWTSITTYIVIIVIEIEIRNCLLISTSIHICYVYLFTYIISIVISPEYVEAIIILLQI